MVTLRNFYYKIFRHVEIFASFAELQKTGTLVSMKYIPVMNFGSSLVPIRWNLDITNLGIPLSCNFRGYQSMMRGPRGREKVAVISMELGSSVDTKRVVRTQKHIFRIYF